MNLELRTNIVFYPVLEEQIAVGTPSYERPFLGVVVTIIIKRLLYGQSFAKIALVFRIEPPGRVFRVSCNVELLSLSRHHHRDAALLAFHNERQFGHLQDVFLADFRMAAVRHGEDVVEATEDGQLGLERRLREDAEHLLLQRIFPDAVVVVESGLRSPTYK